MPVKKLLKFLQQSDGSLRKKTIRAGIWLGLSNAVLSSLGFIRSIVLARLLSPEIFGLWAICMMYIRGVNVLTETGFGAALIHRKDSFDEARDTAFTFMVLRGILLTLLTLACAPLVAMFFEQDIIHPLISVLALALFFTGFLNMNVIHKQKELDFKLLVYLEQAQTLVSFLLVVLLAYFYRDIWALVIAHVVSSLIYVILSFLIIPGRPRFALNKKIAWELFHYGKFITGLSIIVFITTEIDNAVIGKILGMEALGFYVLAYTLANLPATHFSKILSKILFPAYSKMQDNLPALGNALSRAIKFVSLTTIPVGFLFIALSEELVVIIYGERWLPAAEALAVLAVFGFLRAISSLNGYLYNAIGKPNIPFYFNLAKLVIIAIAIIPATKYFGIVGTAVSITIPLLIQFIASLYVITRILNTEFWSILTPIFKHLVLSIAMAALLIYMKEFVDQASILSLLAFIFIGLLAYAIACKRDIRELIQTVALKQ